MAAAWQELNVERLPEGPGVPVVCWQCNASAANRADCGWRYCHTEDARFWALPFLLGVGSLKYECNGCRPDAPAPRKNKSERRRRPKNFVPTWNVRNRRAHY